MRVCGPMCMHIARHFGPRRHPGGPRRGQVLVHLSRPQHWESLEGAGQREEGKQEDLIHHCW